MLIIIMALNIHRFIMNKSTYHLPDSRSNDFACAENTNPRKIAKYIYDHPERLCVVHILIKMMRRELISKSIRT